MPQSVGQPRHLVLNDAIEVMVPPTVMRWNVSRRRRPARNMSFGYRPGGTRCRRRLPFPSGTVTASSSRNAVPRPFRPPTRPSASAGPRSTSGSPAWPARPASRSSCANAREALDRFLDAPSTYGPRALFSTTLETGTSASSRAASGRVTEGLRLCCTTRARRSRPVIAPSCRSFGRGAVGRGPIVDPPRAEAAPTSLPPRRLSPSRRPRARTKQLLVAKWPTAGGRPKLWATRPRRCPSRRFASPSHSAVIRVRGPVRPGPGPSERPRRRGSRPRSP